MNQNTSRALPARHLEAIRCGSSHPVTTYDIHRVPWEVGLRLLFTYHSAKKYPRSHRLVLIVYTYRNQIYRMS